MDIAKWNRQQLEREENERIARNARTDKAVADALANPSTVQALTATCRTHPGEEPSCPRCGYRNAMLHRAWVDVGRRSLVICRDCNHPAWADPLPPVKRQRVIQQCTRLDTFAPVTHCLLSAHHGGDCVPAVAACLHATTPDGVCQDWRDAPATACNQHRCYCNHCDGVRAAQIAAEL